MKRIGFIGPGKVGGSLGRHIAENGGDSFRICGYFGRDKKATEEAAAFAGGHAFDSGEELAAACDLLLLTVPDKEIKGVWDSLSGKLQKRKDPLYVGHCSGSLSSAVFQPVQDCHSGTMHPILAVHDKEKSFKDFQAAYFTIEGDDPFKAFASDLLAALGNPYCVIDSEQKTLYHAATVMVSNLVCALTYITERTFEVCGLDEQFADKAWRSLFIGNAENIFSFGSVWALTGPVERCDTETVASHLETLTGDVREIYLLLSKR